MKTEAKFALISLIAAGIIKRISGVEEQCYCWDKLNQTMRASIPHNIPPENIPAYQYLGLKVMPSGAYDNCLCSDVYRIEGSLTVENETIYNMTADGKETKLKESLANAVKNIMQANNSTKNEYLTLTVTAMVVNNSLPETLTSWKLNIFFRGRLSKDALISEVKALINANSTTVVNGTYNFGGLTKISQADPVFKAVVCLDGPPAAPGNGTREWAPTLSNYPGAKAIYKCNAGFFLTSGNAQEESTCLHEGLTFFKPTTAFACNKGCSTTPPDPPFFVSRKWLPSSRNEGDIAKYICINDYRSKNPNLPNETSVCSGSTWSALDPSFKCEQILCPEAIPQVPAFAATDWNGIFRNTKTQIHYFCKNGYKSTKYRAGVMVTCLAHGEWDPLPKDFECLNKVFAPIDDAYREYDLYTDSGIKPKVAQEKNLFFIITVPCIIALILAIFFCLCCCRTDSPIFILCTGNTNNTSYLLGY